MQKTTSHSETTVHSKKRLFFASTSTSLPSKLLLLCAQPIDKNEKKIRE